MERYKSKIIIVLALIFLFSGCAVVDNQYAKHYLIEKEFDKGLALANEKLNEDASSDSMNYYKGRYLLAKKEYKQALNHLKKASSLDVDNTKYMFWLGVAYAANKDYPKEREQYLKVLEEDEKYIYALIYLGHNYQDSNENDKAYETYKKALDIYEYSSSSLFNYALVAKKLNKKEESIEYFLKFLNYYPSGTLARAASNHLNELGDFTYSNYKIGRRTITIRNMDYLVDDKNMVEYYSQDSLKLIGTILKNNKDISIHIVSYEKDNLKDAEKKVKNIKKFILQKFPEIDFSRVKISWLDKQKIVTRNTKKYVLNRYVNFFTSIKG